MMFRCLAPIVLAVTAMAQPAAPPKPASVEGKVGNSVSNEPLRKVDLTLSNTMGEGDVEEMQAAMAMFGGGDDTPTPAPAPKIEKKTFKATTDSAGKFRFDHVDPGDYYLTATHAGFMDEHYKPDSHQGMEGKLHLASGDELAGIAIRMTPQGAVSGKVVDEDGDPMPNAMVIAMTFSYTSGHRKLSPADSGTTNDRGEYRLGKLPPGHYFISASKVGFDPMGTVAPPPKDGSPETGYVSTYYPGATDVSLASKVDVGAAADLTGFIIHLQKSKVVRVKGQALTADGTPMKGGQVMLMNPSNMGTMQMGTVKPEGQFELAHVQPGSYTLMTIQMGGSKPSITMQPIVVPEEGLTNVKLGTQPEKTIQGRIVAAGNDKVELKGLTVMLEGDDSMPTMPAMGTTTESGAFTLKVNPSPYELRLAQVPPGTYVKSVMLNGRDVLGKQLDFSSGAGDLLVTLGTDGGKVDATVTLRDKLLFDATVVLLPADPARRFPDTTKETSTDETGHVTVKDVPPGDYLVFAWEKVESGEWFDPDYERSIEKQAAKVTVGPKGSERVEIKAIPRV